MISEISIKNFKSIEDLSLPLGRVTVLIGENGSGKSNILEAIGFLGAAKAEKLDNEFLWPRGIRNVEPDLMISAFPDTRRRDGRKSIDFKITSPNFADSKVAIRYFKSSKPGENPHWGFHEGGKERMFLSLDLDLVKKLSLPIEAKPDAVHIGGNHGAFLQKIIGQLAKYSESPPDTFSNLPIENFLIYCPENSILRPLGSESQILPLGTKGEGLFPSSTALPKKGP